MTLILEECDLGDWDQVSSEIAKIEINAIPDANRRVRVQLLLPEETAIMRLTQEIFARAGKLEKIGFKPADALHVAAAEQLGSDVLLTCDDRLCRLARRRRDQLKVRVDNPLDWLKEVGHGKNP